MLNICSCFVINQLEVLTETLAVFNSCLLENGGCEHFCDEDEEGQRLNCSCADGYRLDSDGRSCMTEGGALRVT